MADVDYEAVLEEEGLAPVRDGVADKTTSLDHRLRRTRSTKDAEQLVESVGALRAWSTWANGILATYAFDSERSKRIWEMYAEGRKFSEIAKAEGIHRALVYQYTDRVKRRCPPPPTRHPHRKSGGDARIEDYERLRKTVAANPELLLQGENMARSKVTYSKIQFMQGRHLNIPGNSVSKEFLFNVEGTPHAGGIDLEIDAKDKEYKPMPMVITVPWHSIRQADRAAVDG